MSFSCSRFALLTVFAISILGCATRAHNAVRTRAASDFSCPAEDIQMKELTSGFNVFEYTASGCEKSNQYQAKCGRYFVLCDVSTFSEIDQRNAEADDYMKRTTGCHSDSDCLKYGDGLTCHDYVCKK